MLINPNVKTNVELQEANYDKIDQGGLPIVG